MMRDGNAKYESLDDLFDFGTETETKEDNNTSEMARKYHEKFGHAIPFYLLPETVPESDVFEKVKSCLESGEDNILELFGVKIDDDALY